MQNAVDYIKDILSKPEKDTGFGWFSETKASLKNESSAHDISNLLTYVSEPGIRLWVNNCSQGTVKLSGRRMYSAAQKDMQAGDAVTHTCLVTKFIKEKLIPVLWVYNGSFGDWYICFNCSTEEYVGAIYTSDTVTECRKYHTSDLLELIGRVDSGDREVLNWGVDEFSENNAG